ncbi:hypothetical protein [Streptomyces sp. NPDC007264]|uniref:hypothetical protein n=1 Tax=Streptomyces sp. NPDC007264 TaxID=3364777 RepID=UPI0036D9B86C
MMESDRANGEINGSASLLVRHVRVFVSILLVYGGITLVIGLFHYLAAEGFNVPTRRLGCSLGEESCRQGAEVLALGFFAPAAVLVFPAGQGWKGPTDFFMLLAFPYGAGGVSLATMAGVARGDEPVFVAVLLAVLSVAAGAFFVYLMRKILEGARTSGWSRWMKGTFWILESLPESKRKRKRVLRERGRGSSSLRYKVLVPETTQEKMHWAVFLGEAVSGIALGVLGGLVVIERVV